MREFKKLQLNPKGKDVFVFVWIKKELFAEVMMHFDNQGYNYMENVSWIELSDNISPEQEKDIDGVNELVLTRESEGIFTSSHDTFLVFRTKKDKKKKMRNEDKLELALQTNFDVIFTRKPPNSKSKDHKNIQQFTYQIFEMLMNFESDEIKNQYLAELWPLDRAQRDGWIKLILDPN